MATAGKNDKPILMDFDAVSLMQAMDRKYITKYINKLSIRATRVESIKD